MPGLFFTCSGFSEGSSAHLTRDAPKVADATQKKQMPDQIRPRPACLHCNSGRFQSDLCLSEGCYEIRRRTDFSKLP